MLTSGGKPFLVSQLCRENLSLPVHSFRAVPAKHLSPICCQQQLCWATRAEQTARHGQRELPQHWWTSQSRPGSANHPATTRSSPPWLACRQSLLQHKAALLQPPWHSHTQHQAWLCHWAPRKCKGCLRHWPGKWKTTRTVVQLVQRWKTSSSCQAEGSNVELV